MRISGYGPTRPNVMPARFPNDILPAPNRRIIKDVCDNCKNYMWVYKSILLKRRFKNKIYCTECYNQLSEQEKRI